MRHTLAIHFALSLALGLAGCAVPALESAAPLPSPEDPGARPEAARPMRTLDGEGVVYVATEDPARPRARYLDGQVSLNAHCAIRVANKLNRRIPPVYVNGQPIGFC